MFLTRDLLAKKAPHHDSPFKTTAENFELATKHIVPPPRGFAFPDSSSNINQHHQQLFSAHLLLPSEGARAMMMIYGFFRTSFSPPPGERPEENQKNGREM
jgi:hypothetical protein